MYSVAFLSYGIPLIPVHLQYDHFIALGNTTLMYPKFALRFEAIKEAYFYHVMKSTLYVSMYRQGTWAE